MQEVVCALCAGVTEKHFKEKLPRVLGLGNTTPDAATMTTGVRGLMFGDYMVPGNTQNDCQYALHSSPHDTRLLMSIFHLAMHILMLSMTLK